MRLLSVTVLLPDRGCIKDLLLFFVGAWSWLLHYTDVFLLILRTEQIDDISHRPLDLALLLPSPQS